MEILSKALQKLPRAHDQTREGHVGSGRREVEEGLRAACGYRKGRCKGDGWDLTALGEQHKKMYQSCVALWEVGVGGWRRDLLSH